MIIFEDPEDVRLGSLNNSWVVSSLPKGQEDPESVLQKRKEDLEDVRLGSLNNF